MERTAAAALEYDMGLRAYMTGVFNRMGIAVLMTGILAYFASVEPLKSVFFSVTSAGKLNYTIMGWVVALLPLAIILFSGAMRSARGSAIVLYGVAAAFGLSLGSIFLQYTGASIFTTFLATSAAFGSLSLWGYVTKKNLSGWGNFLLMALIGLLVVMIINIFIGSTAMSLIISAVGILVFAGFIAYDTQAVKLRYDPTMGAENMAMMQNDGALNLYLDFINMFLFILRFVGINVGDD